MSAALAQPLPAGPAEASPELPALRAELQLIDSPANATGSAGILIVDPVRNSYFRLAYPAAYALLHWREGAVGAVQASVLARHGIRLSEAQVLEVAEFLLRSELTAMDRQRSWKGLANRQRDRSQGLLAKAFHNYLFLRIPLLAPERLLEHLLPVFRGVISRGFLLAYAGLMLLASALIARQWDDFSAEAARMFSIEALPAYAVMLFGLKCVHELGHALAARHFGCRVPTMGIALMVGVPVLYTDTTDTWRLAERWQRLAVVLAGVGAEMLVAGLALLSWSFLPEGQPRQMACALATMSVITSLTLNLNPCMRFDGYFALSDILDVPNLQERSFALTTAHLRQAILGLPGPALRDVTPGMARLLIVYGYVTWVYRAVLYTGIAVMVYLMSFKLLGIVLFALELVFFLLRPLGHEAVVWWKLRGEIAGNSRARWSMAIVATVAGLLLLPLSRVVDAPAVLSARQEAAVHAWTAARIAAVFVHDGQDVETGQVLMRLEAPAIGPQKRRVQAELAALEARLARAPAHAEDRDAGQVLESQFRSAREKLAALDRLARDLDIRAPQSGVVVDLVPGLRPGVWINQGQELARVVEPRGMTVRALVTETDARRLSPEASAAFISETGLKAPLPVRLVTINEDLEHAVSEPVLSETYGGPVAVSDDGKASRPRSALVAVTFESNGAAPLLFERGTVRIAAASESLLGRSFRRAAQVLVRESGF